ncbi:MAG: primosomal protein N' [Gammaproteobacteria bacterium]
MADARRILQVAVSNPLNSLFDYLAPKGGAEPGAGQRVRVPFGKRMQIGVIAGVSDTSSVAPGRLRAALEILDDEPLLDPLMLELLAWCASYYQHPPGDVYAAALPAALRRGAPAVRDKQQEWCLTARGSELDAAELEIRAPVQAKIIRALQDRGPLSPEQLRGLHAGWSSVTTKLEEKGWAEQRVAEDHTAADSRSRPVELGPSLTDAQSEALRAIPDRGFQPCLLEGVTGSGKTEVYLQLINRQLEQHRQSLVLVPEIGLTPQLVDRFRRRIAGDIAVMHSGLTDSQRLEAWLAAYEGKADVIIGTRSAIFTPLARPGLIVIDEEHDSSFKQQDGFRYSARDVAVYRGRQLNIPVVLGSATPSFESLHNALEKRYLHVALPERPGNAQQPDVHLVDLRQHAPHEGLSQPLLNAMRTQLESGGQALIYLNRRGFAPILLCPECGTPQECARCDARMVLHQRRQRLVCHHCASERRVSSECSICGHELVPVGQGTERLEETLQKIFPDFPLVRIDRDTTRRRGELERLLDTIRNKEARILLGTQMLTKGHDFPEVSFVGIVDSDQGLFGTDFRSSERLAQSILQVSGRAGRGDRPGEVWIQTYYPDHPLLQTLLTEGYSGFAASALQERREAVWPPFSHLALLRAECADRDLLFSFLNNARSAADKLAVSSIRILGPASSPMERRSGRFRAQILVQSSNRVSMQRFLSAWRVQFAGLKDARRIRWSLDIDPVELF